MSQRNLDQLIRTAIQQGLLPESATDGTANRPWPVVLLTGLGVWLAAIPLTVAIFLVFGEQLTEGSLSYALGAALLIGAILALHVRNTEFIEQLAFPALLVGGLLLSVSFYRDMSPAAAASLLTLLAVGATWAVPQTWLRMLLGALACVAFICMVLPQSSSPSSDLLGTLHWPLLAWVLALTCAELTLASSENADNLIAMEAGINGWAAVLLLYFAYSSGDTFLISAALKPWHGSTSAPIGIVDIVSRLVPVGLAAAATVWLAHRWPAFRSPRILLAAALLTTLCFLIPLLGGPLLILAICVGSKRWALGIAAGVSASWIIGSFYYQLDMPLTTKALFMMGAGAAFGLIAWLGWRNPKKSEAAVPVRLPKLNWGLCLSLAATLIVANIIILQKEVINRNGRLVFIEIAPVDPRSLMQGDYMRLNFIRPELRIETRRVKVVAQIDARGIAVLRREATGTALAPDEIIIELPLSDAWYFKEGEAKRWENARYGEFRIDSNGRSLLVNLRGEKLEEL